MEEVADQVESFRGYFEDLERLTLADLDRRTGSLAITEKRHTARLIAHLAEISRRKAHLQWGYKNLFDYCLRRLNLSEGSIWLRTQVANVARRFPQVLSALAEGKINLSIAGHLAPHLREENVDDLLRDCAWKSRREVDERLAALRPKPAFKPSIRELPSASREDGVGSDEGAARQQGVDVAGPLHGGEEDERDGERMMMNPRRQSCLLEPASPSVYNFRFFAGREFRENLERLAEVLGIENPVRDMAEVLARAVDVALEKKDPIRKRERRLERERRRQETAAAAQAASAEGPRPDEVSRETKPSEEETRSPRPADAPPPPLGASAPAGGPGPAPSRRVPAAVQERVFHRAGYRCEYESPSGNRCPQRTGLEIEHTRPFAIFRSHDEAYLRVYCRRHNALRAEEVYGAERIRRKIEERRRGPGARTGASGASVEASSA